LNEVRKFSDEDDGGRYGPKTETALKENSILGLQISTGWN
jgi:hypothetical protein